MPISKVNKSRYPANWAFISADIRFNRAGNRCEKCGIQNGSISPITHKKISLSVHHKDHQPENNDYSNLIALCNRCHIKEDAKHHKENRYKGQHRLNLGLD